MWGNMRKQEQRQNKKETQERVRKKKSSEVWKVKLKEHENKGK